MRRRRGPPSLRERAVALAQAGRWYEAVRAAERAVVDAIRRRGPDHLDAAHAQWVLGTMLVGDEQAPRAALHFEHALRIRRWALGERHRLTGCSAASLGSVRFGLGDYAGAVAPLEVAVVALADFAAETRRRVRACWKLAQALWAERLDLRRARHLVEEVRAETTAAGRAPNAALEQSAREWLGRNRVARAPVDIPRAPRPRTTIELGPEALRAAQRSSGGRVWRKAA